MIGQKIKQYLEDNGIKQTFIAEKIGISKQKMSYICTSNSNKDVDCVTYYKICKALNVPLETFLVDESPEEE